MTDQNKQNENEQAGQSKVATLYSILSDKFEPLAKLPQMKLPIWYGLVFLALIIIIFAWKQIAVSKLESELANKLENERATITQQALEHADKEYNKEEERFGLVLSWAVRGELIRNNLDQISQYLNEIVKLKDTEKVVLIGDDGQLLISTDKRLEEAAGSELYPAEVLNQQRITVKSNVNGKKLLVVPVMGLNTRLGTIVVSYNQAVLKN